ncbi:hypothetical protein FK216_03285 [Moraxellaceae bacterium AER2_44_116]|nr:hypothetical protein [Moraxellaceae bacterium]TQC99271.1 hypothetical protein FK216_03285 [Moraxellaceae bacterium AER2_44_116]
MNILYGILKESDLLQPSDVSLRKIKGQDAQTIGTSNAFVIEKKVGQTTYCIVFYLIKKYPIRALIGWYVEAIPFFDALIRIPKDYEDISVMAEVMQPANRLFQLGALDVEWDIYASEYWFPKRESYSCYYNRINETLGDDYINGMSDRNFRYEEKVELIVLSIIAFIDSFVCPFMTKIIELKGDVVL